jgi:uncharacterized YigZ family protein
MKMDEFKTIRRRVRTEIKVQGSRFIATAASVSSKQEADRFVEEMRKEFHSATHNCYAYRIGTDTHQFRFNDDGEPAGTAGKPILASIDRLVLTDIVIVVTRYFGGTKLGTGGLARAYAEAAEGVLAGADHVTKYRMGILRASFPHSQVGNVMRAVSRAGARIVDTVYDEEVHVQLEIRRSLLEDLRSLLVESTSGNIDLKVSGENSQ